MKIKVEVKNNILGDSVFWEGDSTKVDEIRNIPAKLLAKKVILDGKTRKAGMWVVSESLQPCACSDVDNTGGCEQDFVRNDNYCGGVMSIVDW